MPNDCSPSFKLDLKRERGILSLLDLVMCYSVLDSLVPISLLTICFRQMRYGLYWDGGWREEVSLVNGSTASGWIRALGNR
jgi:hypothetical protein